MTIVPPLLTATYAAAFGILFVMLSVRVVMLRAKYGIELGDGGEAALLRAIRGHGNFTEYVPITLVLIALAESLGLGAIWIHVAALTVLAARLAHPFGLYTTSRSLGQIVLRAVPTTANWIVILAIAGWLIVGR